MVFWGFVEAVLVYLLAVPQTSDVGSLIASLAREGLWGDDTEQCF